MKKIVFRSLICSFSLFFLFKGFSFADPIEIKITEPNSITARAFEYPILKIPGSTSILDTSDIDFRAPLDIGDIAVLVPGIGKSGDSPWASEFSIRGRSRESVLLLIDGARVNTSTDIGARFGLVDLYDIEKVEILKGPISSLYGSGTIGGVVNIITKGEGFSETPMLHAGALSSALTNPQGSHGYIYSGYKDKDSYVYLSQALQDFDSYEDGNGTGIFNSQFESYQTKFRSGEKIGEYLTIEGQYQYFEGDDIGIPGAGTAPIPSFAKLTYPSVDRRLVQIKASVDPNIDFLNKSSISLYSQTVGRWAQIEGFPESFPVSEIRPSANHRTIGVNWTNITSFRDNTPVFGVDIWERSLDSIRIRNLKSSASIVERPLPDAEFLSTGFFVEDTWNVSEDTSLNIGGRRDFISVDNKATEKFPSDEVNDRSYNAHIGATQNLFGAFAVKGIIARGFRAPEIEERFAFLDLGGGKTKLGDPYLEPEESLLKEIDLVYDSDDLVSTMSFFHNDLDNLISEKIIDENLIKSANFKEAQIYGVEYEAILSITECLKLRGNISHLVGDDLTDDEPLPQISPISGFGEIQYDPKEGFYYSLETSWAGRQGRTPEGIKDSPGWQIVSLRAGKRFKGSLANFEAYAGINNLFDKYHRNYLATSRGFDLPEPGRSLLIGLNYYF